MSNYRVNIIRVVLLLFAQILIFNFVRITWFNMPFIEVFLYPLILFLFPLRISNSVLIFIGFLVGLIVDVFQNTPGVHSGAGAFSGFIRPYVINYLAPRGGYKVNIAPTIDALDLRWFSIYCAIMISFHCFVVSLMDVFQIKLLHYILLRTILTGLVSYVVIMITMIVFDPKE